MKLIVIVPIMQSLILTTTITNNSCLTACSNAIDIGHEMMLITGYHLLEPPPIWGVTLLSQESCGR